MIAGVVWFLGPHHKLWVAGLVLVLLGLLGWLIFILPAYWDRVAGASEPAALPPFLEAVREAVVSRAPACQWPRWPAAPPAGGLSALKKATRSISSWTFRESLKDGIFDDPSGAS